jgi:hypothetical protein
MKIIHLRDSDKLTIDIGIFKYVSVNLKLYVKDGKVIIIPYDDASPMFNFPIKISISIEGLTSIYNYIQQVLEVRE